MTGEVTLDPEEWDEASMAFHQAVDRCILEMRSVRNRPVWQKFPENIKNLLQTDVPQEPRSLSELCTFFCESLLPYSNGNTHPRFFGWVHGSGNIAGVAGEMLAAFMNANLGGRDHAAVYIERQVLNWCKQIFSFPVVSSGLVTTGTSMSTLIALTVARNVFAGGDVQKIGLANLPARLVGYTSSEAHCSVAKAFDQLGLGQDALRRIPADNSFRLDTNALLKNIQDDRAAGYQPICVTASAGTVNTGAIDDLETIAQICREQNLWMHVDGAFGGLAILSDTHKDSLKGIEQADSIAFDFHKWLHVPYDAGCVLIKNEAAHRKAYSSRMEYLSGSENGLAGGDPWFCEYGPELSRGFRALKVWFTLQTYGLNQFAKLIEQNCRQAKYLSSLVTANSELEMLAEVSLNIACFRYIGSELAPSVMNKLNAAIVTELQTEGVAAPSTTTIRGCTAIRVAITNHRTVMEDMDTIVAEVCRLGRKQLCQ